MKKLYVPLVLALLAGCTRMEQEAPIGPQEPVVPEGYKVLTINASRAGDTKTSYAGDKTFSWNVGDQISVICNDGENNFWQTFTATTAAASSSFTATVADNIELGPLDHAHSKVAMYPASSNHYYGGNWNLKYHIPAERDFRAASGGHDESAIPMFAWGTDEDTYAFSNLSGAAKFTFTGLESSAVKMTFTVPGVKLNGTFNLQYSSIDKDDSSEVHWGVASASEESEKTVTYYADVTDGKAVFYVPYGEGSIWGYSHLTLTDVASDKVLYENSKVGNITVHKNQIAVLPTLDLSFKSAYGIDWKSVTAAENANVSYPAIKKMRATLDDDYVYLLLEVDPSILTKDHDYDHYINIYVADASGGANYWGAEKYKRIGKQSWAVHNGAISFANWTPEYSSSNLKEYPNTWYYEIRISRTYCPELSGTGTIKLGVDLDDTYYDGEYKRLNGYVPYGVIPTYGTDMYTLELPSTLALSFTEATGEVTNPERGMMSYSKFTFENGTIPSVKSIPVNYSGESLAFLLFYMPDYIDKDLDDAAKTFIQAELDKVRERDMKAVVRFAYEESYSTTEPQEAEPDQILEHNDQLADIFSTNADIIYTVQAGWLGTYGEWYYKTNNHDNVVPGRTDYYLYTTSGSAVTDLNNNHKELVDKMLSVVPSPINIGLRTAFYKRYYLSPDAISSWTPITEWAATPGANERLAFYNDGLRGSVNDVGTFQSTADRTMWYSQGNWLACGGEMSYRSASAFAELDDDLKDCDLSIAEMRKQHLSYLHYSTDNLFMTKWIGEGRLEDLKKMLGYRLVLGDVDFAYASLLADETVSYSIEIKNTGCAPVIYPRPFKLVLLHGSTPTVLADLGDIRDIAAEVGFTALTGSFDWPFTVTSGDRLAIWLPDNAAGLQSKAAYSIRLANKEVTWDSGYNVIHTF